MNNVSEGRAHDRGGGCRFHERKQRIIAPIILVICVICAIGACTVHNNTFDMVMMLVFGVAGYLLKKCNYPLAAAGLGHRAWRQGRGSLPAVSADLAG